MRFVRESRGAGLRRRRARSPEQQAILRADVCSDRIDDHVVAARDKPGRARPGTKPWSSGCQVTGPTCALGATRRFRRAHGAITATITAASRGSERSPARRRGVVSCHGRRRHRNCRIDRDTVQRATHECRPTNQLRSGFPPTRTAHQRVDARPADPRSQLQQGAPLRCR